MGNNCQELFIRAHDRTCLEEKCQKVSQGVLFSYLLLIRFTTPDARVIFSENVLCNWSCIRYLGHKREKSPFLIVHVSSSLISSRKKLFNRSEAVTLTVRRTVDADPPCWTEIIYHGVPQGDSFGSLIFIFYVKYFANIEDGDVRIKL